MATRPIELGLVLPLLDDPRSGASFSWDAIRSQARFAEVAGFDTVWIPDELVWAVPSWPGPRGWWECAGPCPRWGGAPWGWRTSSGCPRRRRG